MLPISIRFILKKINPVIKINSRNKTYQINKTIKYKWTTPHLSKNTTPSPKLQPQKYINSPQLIANPKYKKQSINIKKCIHLIIQSKDHTHLLIIIPYKKINLNHCLETHCPISKTNSIKSKLKVRTKNNLLNNLIIIILKIKIIKMNKIL